MTPLASRPRHYLATLTLAAASATALVAAATPATAMDSPTPVQVSTTSTAAASDQIAHLDTRVFDSRSANSSTGGARVAANSVTRIDLSGLPGLTEGDLVGLNLVAVDPVSPGYLTAYGSGDERPLASNLNYVAGQVRANTAYVRVGPDRTARVYTMSETHIVVDATIALKGAGYQGLAAPVRVMDMREGIWPDSMTQRADVGMVPGAPDTMRGAIINLTVVGVEGFDGFVSVNPAPSNDDTVATSSINFSSNTPVANTVLAATDENNLITLRMSEPASLIVDVLGYVTTDADLVFTEPTRLADTRASLPETAWTAPAPAVGVMGRATTIQTAGSATAGTPTAAPAAVFGNLTLTGTEAPGFASLYQPLTRYGRAEKVSYEPLRSRTSALNYAATDTVASSIATPVNSAAAFGVYSLTGAHHIFDMTAYLPANTAVPPTAPAGTDATGTWSRTNGPIRVAPGGTITMTGTSGSPGSLTIESPLIETAGNTERHEPPCFTVGSVPSAATFVWPRSGSAPAGSGVTYEAAGPTAVFTAPTEPGTYRCAAATRTLENSAVTEPVWIDMTVSATGADSAATALAEFSRTTTRVHTGGQLQPGSTVTFAGAAGSFDARTPISLGFSARESLLTFDGPIAEFAADSAPAGFDAQTSRDGSVLTVTLPHDVSLLPGITAANGTGFGTLSVVAQTADAQARITVTDMSNMRLAFDVNK